MSPKIKKQSGKNPLASSGRKYVRSWSYKEFKRRYSRLHTVGMIARTGEFQDIVRQKDLTDVIEKMQKVQLKMNDILLESRKESRTGGGGGGGGTPPNSNIFNRLVDEKRLADSILEIVNKYFHGAKECEICKIKINVYVFFLLMHYYFDYIHILENNKLSPFCEYLNQKVFGGNNKIGVRNFNNYAKNKKYTNFGKLLAEETRIKFKNRPKLPRPKTEHYLLAPFQEIGWNFQYSSYFDELRRQKMIVHSFKI